MSIAFAATHCTVCCKMKAILKPDSPKIADKFMVENFLTEQGGLLFNLGDLKNLSTALSKLDAYFVYKYLNDVPMTSFFIQKI